MVEDSKSTQNQPESGATEQRAASAPSSKVKLRTTRPSRTFIVGETTVTYDGVELSASEAERVEAAAKKSNVPVERV